ncbi:hypothetical protein EDB89DRAFT_2076394 [Lactarius sanguifluus]|nr:hypothetical protein EDB89DRAFT_2076394 [Lactarius sanguifluus]
MLTTPTTSAANGRPTHSQPLSSVLPSTAPPDHRLNWEDYTYPTELLQRPRNAPDPEAAPSPQRIPVFEYQWRDELVNHLSELPPRSNFGGKFAIIADPDVDNGMRAQIFADQLRAQGVPISERHSASRTQDTMHAHTLVFPCRCEDGCQGRFLVSVGDDTSHPYGVPGQRIGVALYHPSTGRESPVVTARRATLHSVPRAAPAFPGV